MITEKPPLKDDSETHLTATFTGKEQPTAVSEVISAAALAGATIIDLRQIVIQCRMTIVIELTVPCCSKAESMFYKSLLTAADALSLAIDFNFATKVLPSQQLAALTLQEASEIGAPGNGFKDKVTTNYPIQKPTHYVVTLLSQDSITPSFLSYLASMLAERTFTTEKITRLSAREMRCLELVVATVETLTPSDINLLRKKLYALGSSAGIDVALQAESVLRRSKRLVVLDMDSTLIQQEVIDELARYAGVFDEVCEITHRAMAGKIDFRESLKERVALLKGAPTNTFDQVVANLQYTAGAKLFCKTLKRLGYRLAVISGGFTRVTSHVKHELGLDYDYANQLEEEDGVFTGRTLGPVVNAQRKADLLATIAQLERITLDQVIAIGDGANDLPMLGTAGLGIAFNAKAAVQEAARFRINQPSLMSVLYLLGLSEQDQEELSGRGGSTHSGGSN